MHDGTAVFLIGAYFAVAFLASALFALGVWWATQPRRDAFEEEMRAVADANLKRLRMGGWDEAA